MGLSDILKSAVKKGMVFAEEVGLVENKERLQEARERERQLAVAKEEEERQRVAAAKKERIERITKPTCEKGDCLWNMGRFYFTCDECIECERKKTTRNSWGATPVYPGMWPYMKRYECIKKKYDKEKEKSYQSSYISHEIYDEMDELIADLLADLMPKFLPYAEKLRFKFLYNGITPDNPLFDLLWYLKDKDVKMTGYIMSCLIEQVANDKYLHIDLDFYRNLSLYRRSEKEFAYTAKTFEVLLDKEACSQYFSPEKVNMSELFDADGNIKEAGIGGPQAGFYGDTIWNVIESWSEN